MRRDDRGAVGAEYVALIVLAGAIVAALATTGLPDHIVRNAKVALCMVFQGSDCSQDGPAVVDAGDGSAGDTGPVTDFVDGGVGRLVDSFATAGCLVHLCSESQFQETWDNAGLAVTAPVLNSERVPCRDWRNTAPGTPSTRPDGSSRQEYTIGTFNMYGNVGHHGEVDEVVPAIVRSVEDREPVFLALNEVCETQADALRDALGAEYEVFFSPTPKKYTGPSYGPYTPAPNPDDLDDWVTCRDEETDASFTRFGNAVVYRKDFADDMQETSHSLHTPGDGDYNRSAPCVSSAAKNVVFCSAHLDHDETDARETEAENLRQVFDDHYEGYTTMLGGDLNDTPGSDTLNNFYDPGYGGDAHGNMKETDSVNVIDGGYGRSCRGGESTHGNFFTRKKIDYLFVSGDAEIHWSDATNSDVSDHDPLWSGVTF